jgi:hypothetical protein
VVTGVETRDQAGKLVFYNEFTSFIRGAGGYVHIRPPARPSFFIGICVNETI